MLVHPIRKDYNTLQLCAKYRINLCMAVILHYADETVMLLNSTEIAYRLMGCPVLISEYYYEYLTSIAEKLKLTISSYEIAEV